MIPTKSMVQLHFEPPPLSSIGKPIYLRPHMVTCVTPAARGCTVWLVDGSSYVVIEHIDEVVHAMGDRMLSFHVSLPEGVGSVEVWINPAWITHCVDANDYVEVRMMGGRSMLFDEPFTNILHAMEQAE